MGRRRKRRKRMVKKVRMPARYFNCPRCGSMTLTIDFEKRRSRPGFKLAVARCGTCGLHCELEVPELLERIDVYNRIVDLVYEDRLDECAPKEEAPAGEEAGDEWEDTGEPAGEEEEG